MEKKEADVEKVENKVENELKIKCQQNKTTQPWITDKKQRPDKYSHLHP